MAASRRNLKRAGGKPPVSGREKIPEKALVMSGFGINSEMETQEALARAGMTSDIVHINDLISGQAKTVRIPAAGLPGRIFLW